MEQLFALLHAISILSPELASYLSKNLQCKKFKKGEFILREGNVSTHIYFLEKGLVRIYNIHNDKEVTTWFLKEGNIFISVGSFFEQQSSFENIVAMEDCICWGISFQQLEETCSLYPEFEKHHGRILRKYYSVSQIRQFKLARQTPLERYTFLAEQEPELLQRVPLNILHTYLQMSERTFKRARKDYYSSKRK